MQLTAGDFISIFFWKIKCKEKLNKSYVLKIEWDREWWCSDSDDSDAVSSFIALYSDTALMAHLNLLNSQKYLTSSTHDTCLLHHSISDHCIIFQEQNSICLGVGDSGNFAGNVVASPRFNISTINHWLMTTGLVKYHDIIE